MRGVVLDNVDDDAGGASGNCLEGREDRLAWAVSRGAMQTCVARRKVTNEDLPN